MGCVVSAPPRRPTIPPDRVPSMESNGPRRTATERRLTMPASLRMTSRLRTSSLTWANTSHTRRSSATTGGSRRGSTTMGGDGTASRLYSFFAHRTSTGGRSTSAEPDKLDSLGLGSESNVVSAPSRWLVVLGERGAGKTTLIRQLKMSHDGLDAAEAARYSREVHKLAVTLFKQVVQGVHVHDASKTPEEHAAMERIKGLKRRATVTAEVADDVTFLWAKESIKAAVKTLEDAQLRKSVHHFATNVDRLCSPEFVPQELDLLHLAIPTIGQQETRINCFPGDQICVYETNSELRSSTSVFQGRSSVRKAELFGAGVRAVLFVASATSFHEPIYTQEASPDKRRSNCEPDKAAPLAKEGEHRMSVTCRAAVQPVFPILVPRDTINQWRIAQTIAEDKGVPCLLCISKCDLLETMSLPSGLSPSAVVDAMRSQFFALPTPGGPEGAGTLQKLPSVIDPQEALIASQLKSRALNLLDDTSDCSVARASEMLMSQAFPELDVDEEAVGLEQAVYLCIGAFCPSEGTMLSKRGVMPLTKLKKGSLTLKDHVWLHELPRQLPHPLAATTDAAMMQRLGKESLDETRAGFWSALCALAEQLGSFAPKSLGVLHSAPLLTTSGAILIFLLSSYEAEPLMGASRPRSLAWRSNARVAAKMVGVAQATEIAVDEFFAAARDVVAATPARELSPRVWIEKLCKAAETNAAVNGGDVASPPLRPGTYVVVLYTQSSMTGLRVLVPQKGLSGLPPHVKISDAPLSASDWTQLRELEEAMQTGKTSKVPKDWANGKNWMGPEIGSESHLTAVQKFFYGIIALRQQLQVKCNAIKEELRYSSIAGAVESLDSLGTLQKDKIILADPGGRVQLVLICKHHDLGVSESFPNTLQWQPFPIFEANHYNLFAPQLLKETCEAKDMVLKGLAVHATLCSRHVSNSLRGSGGGMRGSCSESLRGSTYGRGSCYASDMSLDVTDSPSAHTQCELRVEALPPFNAAEEEKAVRDAWDAVRWTRHAVLNACAHQVSNLSHLQDWNMGRGLAAALGNVTASMNRTSPEQRMADHAAAYNKALGDLRRCINRLHGEVGHLQTVLASYEQGIKDKR